MVVLCLYSPIIKRKKNFTFPSRARFPEHNTLTPLLLQPSGYNTIQHPLVYNIIVISRVWLPFQSSPNNVCVHSEDSTGHLWARIHAHNGCSVLSVTEDFPSPVAATVVVAAINVSLIYNGSDSVHIYLFGMRATRFPQIISALSHQICFILSIKMATFT